MICILYCVPTWYVTCILHWAPRSHRRGKLEQLYFCTLGRRWQTFCDGSDSKYFSVCDSCGPCHSPPTLPLRQRGSADTMLASGCGWLYCSCTGKAGSRSERPTGCGWLTHVCTWQWGCMCGQQHPKPLSVHPHGHGSFLAAWAVLVVWCSVVDISERLRVSYRNSGSEVQSDGRCGRAPTCVLPCPSLSRQPEGRSQTLSPLQPPLPGPATSLSSTQGGTGSAVSLTLGRSLDEAGGGWVECAHSWHLRAGRGGDLPAPCRLHHSPAHQGGSVRSLCSPRRRDRVCPHWRSPSLGAVCLTSSGRGEWVPLHPRGWCVGLRLVAGSAQKPRAHGKCVGPMLSHGHRRAGGTPTLSSNQKTRWTG